VQRHPRGSSAASWRSSRGHAAQRTWEQSCPTRWQTHDNTGWYGIGQHDIYRERGEHENQVKVRCMSDKKVLTLSLECVPAPPLMSSLMTSALPRKHANIRGVLPFYIKKTGVMNELITSYHNQAINQASNIRGNLQNQFRPWLPEKRSLIFRAQR
jgi:hypothetical protein